METRDNFAEVLHERFGFTDLAEIGRGGMGVVYRAHDPRLSRFVAIKQLSVDLVGDDSARARFTSEMQTVARISHSAVVSIHTAGITPGGSAFYVMDYVEGHNLADLIRDRKQWGKTFTVDETVELLLPIALALDHLHLKMDPPIIHRDVKPANILVPSHDGFEAKSLLTDFGISLTGDATRLTSLSVVAGTERYTAPELFPGESHGSDGLRSSVPDESSDNYSLALIALEMLTMRSLKDTMPPEQWTSTRRPFPDLSAMGLYATSAEGLQQLERVFRQALATHPAYRYPTANEFIQALARTSSDWAVDSPPQPPLTDESTATTSSLPMATTSGQGQGASREIDVLPQEPTPARRGSWAPVWLLAAVAVTVAAASSVLGTYLVNHPAWGEKEAVVAAAFPDAIPSLENATGWNDSSCSSENAQEKEQARITCTTDDAEITFIDFGDAQTRAEALSVTGERVGWEGNTCSVQSAPAGDDQYIIWLGDPLARFAAVVDGENAENTRLEIPLC